MAGLLLAIACSNGDTSSGANPFQGSQPPGPTPTSIVPAASTPSVASSPVRSTTSSPPEAPLTGFPAVRLQPAFDGATFERMTGLYEDAEGNWYATEQTGRIRRIDAATGEVSLWLDLTDRVDSRGFEMGLLGFALSPDFETTRAFYVDYTGGGQTVVSRFTAAPGHESVDAGSEQRLLAVDQPASNHNGGQIAFGPDGYLYVALGDGGGGNDTFGNGQNLGTLLGSILRIDVSAGGNSYAVPPDNPFVGRSGARGEIWAYGFRNPWRFSFDRASGDLWAGDVGERTREEIDLVVRGGNYGWNVTEGFVCRGGGTDCETTGLLPPVFDYVNGSGGTCSVTGGFVYRGSAIPALRGAYVFSDCCSGVVYALRATDGGVLTEQVELASTGARVSSFAEGRDGEIYVLATSDAGMIYKLVP